jgi:dihydropteroate synthase
VGDGLPVAVMGVINVSPESFHAGSVRHGHDVLATAQAMVDAGAALIDVGARSTAPYLPTEITDAEETARLLPAVALLAAKLAVPVSADTCRPQPARASLEAGARVINDVSTLRDPAVARLVASHSASLVLMAAPQVGEGHRVGAAGVRRPQARGADPLARRLRSAAPAEVGRGMGRRTPATPPRRPSPAPVVTIRKILAEGLRRARAAGIPQPRIVVDPGIGFFRAERLAWDEWDASVLAGLASLRSLARPICVGVSRKSFIGAILDQPETSGRLSGSLAATAIAVLNGAAVIRTHDVQETRDAVRVAERIRQVGAR